MKISVESITPLFKTYKCEIILGLCALFLAYVTATALKKHRGNFPPGPIGLPLVGYLPFLTRDMHLDLMKLGKKYGDVFSLKLGIQDIVILHGGDAIMEAFNKPEFLGRPPDAQKMFYTSAFIGCNFLLWKEQRKIVMKCMKDPIIGKKKFEKNVMNGINHFIDVLRKSEAQPTDIRKPLYSSISNNISSLVFGKRFEYDDPKRQFLDKNMQDFARLFSQIYLDALFPWIRYIPFSNKFLRYRKSRNVIKNYEIFLLEELNEHLKTLNPAHERDFFDRYLVEIDKQRAKHTDTSCNQNMLISNAVDLSLASSEAIHVSLRWFIYIIAAFPYVQKKVQKEIEEVVAPDKTPEYSDMRIMPYTHAVMLEMIRWKSAFALTLKHCTLADTTVGGYNLQKGTTVIANLWAVHHDPRYWDEPEKFKPGRFLSEDGNSVVKPSYFMPFSAGRRACLGESMAYMVLFLYFTSILREFDIVFPDEMEPTFNGRIGFTYEPEPYLVRFIPKN